MTPLNLASINLTVLQHAELCDLTSIWSYQAHNMSCYAPMKQAIR